MKQAGHPGVSVIGGAVDGARLLVLLGPPCLAHLHERGKQAFAVAERDGLPRLEGRREVLAHVERDRDRPEHARREPHAAQHPLVFGGAHESLKRREGAVQQELDIAELARAEVPALRVLGSAKRVVPRGPVEVPVPELAAVRFLERAHPRILPRILRRAPSAPQGEADSSARWCLVKARPSSFKGVSASDASPAAFALTAGSSGCERCNGRRDKPSRLTDRESRRRQGTPGAVGLSAAPIGSQTVAARESGGGGLSRDTRDSPSNTREAGRTATSGAARPRAWRNRIGGDQSDAPGIGDGTGNDRAPR